MPDSDSGSGDRSRPSTSRRKLMAILGASGVTGLAGCGGDSADDTPTETSGGGGTPDVSTNEDPRPAPTATGDEPTATGDEPTATGDEPTATGDEPTATSTPGEPYVSGQRLRFTTTHNPETVSFLGYGSATIRADEGFNFPWPVYRAMAEKGATGRWFDSVYDLNPGKTTFLLFDNVEFNLDSDPSTIRVEIKDEATWSDGEDITVWDNVGVQVHYRMNALSDTGLYKPREVSNPVHAFDEVRMPDGRDGKVYELVDPRDIYSKFPQGWLNRIIMGRWSRTVQPTHVEPITELAEEAWSLFQSAKENDGELPSSYKSAPARIQEIVTKEDLNNWRDPEYVVTSGPWTLGEIRGSQEIVLDPNENYRHADDINYDGVVFEFADNLQRRLASMQSGRLDFLEESLSPAQAQGRPPGMKQRNLAGGPGIAIELDHGHGETPLGQREVRAAMMYAMNIGDIAGNVHPNAAQPISVPGGDNWSVNAVASDSWIEENLIDYGVDSQPDKATSLMQEAGLSKNSNGIWTMDGEPLQYQVATDQSSPRFAQTVASQLSEFGVDVGIQTYSDTKYFDRLRNGPGFDMWRGPGMAGFYNQVASFWWSAMNFHTAFDADGEPGGSDGVRNFFPVEKEQKALEGYADNGWVAGNYQTWEDLNVQIPPIGEPDGSKEPYNVCYQNGVRARGPKSYSQDFYKQMLWVANYWLPVLPLVKQQLQTFYDTAHWHWPTDHYLWQYFPVNLGKGHFLQTNLVDADPENPEEGATVERG